MMHGKGLLLVLCIMCMLGVAPVLRAQEAITLRLISHDSFNVSESVLAAFEAETGITVEVLRLGDAGTMLNQAILTRDNPLGDVLFGVDNTFLGRALAADFELFLPYESPELVNVDAQFQLDAEFRVTPVNYGDVCLNYDIAYFEDSATALPDSLLALTDPAYRGLLVVQNPATSSPGLAFLLATVAEFGTEGEYTYLNYWADLFANGVLVTDGWEQAYFGEFTAGGGGGTRPLVVSYASSPPFTYDAQTDIVTTGSIVADGMCFRQIEFAGILRGTENEVAAQQFIDFLLSVPFQEDLPLQMYVFPVNAEAQLPQLFADYARIPDRPAVLELEAINEHRETWIQAWTELLLAQ